MSDGWARQMRVRRTDLEAVLAQLDDPNIKMEVGLELRSRLTRLQASQAMSGISG